MVIYSARPPLKPSRIMAVFLIILTAGATYWWRLNDTIGEDIPVGMKLKIIGKVTSQPYQKGSYQIFKLGPINVLTDNFHEYFYGDKIELNGKLQSQVINFVLTEYWSYYPDIKLLGVKKSSCRELSLIQAFRCYLHEINQQLQLKIDQVLPEPESSLLSGILLGVKKHLPEKFQDNLRKTGTLHIVVASGQNVSVVANFILATLCLFIVRRRAILLAVVAIVFYVFLAGGEPPVIRAGLMIGLAYLGELLGRAKQEFLSLFFVAFLMLFISPLLLFDIGFQLSFLATAGIFGFYPFLAKQKFFSLPLIGPALATTIAAQAGVAPVLLANFGQVSFLSPLVNALVSPVVPIAMVFGALIAVMGLISQALPQLIAWLTWPFLAYFIKTVDYFGRLDWANWQIGPLSKWWWLGYYLVVVFLAWKINHRQR